jgi:hypothetical protein
MGEGSPSAVAIREELVRLFCNDLLGHAGGPDEAALRRRCRYPGAARIAFPEAAAESLRFKFECSPERGL